MTETFVTKKKSKKIKKSKKKKSFLYKETKASIITIICFTLALISLLSFFGVAGIFGDYFNKISKLVFGNGSFLIIIGFILAGLLIKIKFSYKPVVLGILLFIISFLGILHIFAFSNGGYLGLIIGAPLVKIFSFWASLIFLIALLAISVLVIFNVSFRLGRIFKKKESAQGGAQGGQESIKEESAQGGQEKKSIFKKIINNKIIQSAEAIPAEAIIEPAKIKFAVENSDFKLPPLDFLEKDKGQPTSGDIKANINIIKKTLENFGIEVEMAEVNVGPTVTQYTLRPAQGVKLSKIISLQNDLALSLAAHPIRIEAPIPGRSLVGIEIPNKSMVTVRLRTLLERQDFQEGPMLVFAIGRDVAGNPMFADLARMPHMLIAGATGTGKTIGLNNIITSLLYKNSPENLKLILIDPKRVELTAYESIPHLLTPVIIQPDKAVGALRWAVGEMERRFDVLHKAGKRDVNAYMLDLQKNASNNTAEKLPFIVIVVDELADLMSTHGREVEAAIVRLAQMARAVGIHLLVSTQRPSVEVITGLIKANITSRIAFQVASQIDSRTILDMAGADKLLGNGDLLFLSGNSAKPRRVQGAFVSEKEVRKLTDYLRKSQDPDYADDIDSGFGGNNPRFSIPATNNADTNSDELYEEARTTVIQAGKASASLLQRRLRVGYARAARLLDVLEEQGVVGPADGAKPREVYIDEGVQNNF